MISAKEMTKNEQKKEDFLKETSAQSQAHLVNRIGQVSIFVILVAFNIGFWWVALTEYTRPIEYYLNKVNEASKK